MHQIREIYRENATWYRNKKLYKLLTENAYFTMHEYWNFNLYSKQLNLAISRMLKHK